MKTTQELLLELLEHGKSQHEISRQTKVGQATISRIANGRIQSPYARCHTKVFDYYKSVKETS